MKAFRILLLCATLAAIVAGCKTPEAENVAERPWNAQRGWEHGLPTTINQGR